MRLILLLFLLLLAALVSTGIEKIFELKNKKYSNALFFLLLAAFSSITYFFVDHEYQALISTLAMAGGILTIVYLVLAVVRKKRG